MTTIFEAIDRADFGLAWQLVQSRAGLEEIDQESGLTPLALAAETGMTEVVRTLLEAGVRPDHGGALTPLEAAVLEGDPEIVKLLIEAGADVNRRSGDGFTPLMSAAMAGDEELSRMLLEAGGRARAKNDDGDTSIEIAAKHGFPELSRELRTFSRKDFEAEKARREAEAREEEERRRERRDRLARARAVSKEVEQEEEAPAEGTATEGTATEGAAMEGTGTAGPMPAGRMPASTGAEGPVTVGPVTLGSVTASPATASPVTAGPVTAGPVTAGTGAEGADAAGSPLEARAPSRSGAREGAGPASRELEGSKASETAPVPESEPVPMKWTWSSETRRPRRSASTAVGAREMGTPSTAGEALAAFDALFGSLDDESTSEVDVESLVGVARFRALLAAGEEDSALGMLEDGEIRTDDRDRGETPLMVAASQGSLPLVEALLEEGAEVDARADGFRGETALVKAVRHPSRGREAVIRFLADAGASLEIRVGENAMTPLMFAANADVYEPDPHGSVFGGTVRLLVDLGARLEATDRRGSTAWRMVKRNALGAPTSSPFRRRLYQMQKLLETAGAAPVTTGV